MAEAEYKDQYFTMLLEAKYNNKDVSPESLDILTFHKVASEVAEGNYSEENEESKKSDNKQDILKTEGEELLRLKGKGLYYLFQELDKLGYTATFYDTSFVWIDGKKGAAETKSHFDNSTMYPVSDLKEFWKATEIYNINTDKKTVDIDYVVEESGTTTSNASSTNNLGSGTVASSTSTRPEINSAWTAVEQYGKKQYPYGFKVLIRMGTWSESEYGGDSWLLKAECRIINQYGAKQEMNLEAKVKGPNSSPTVYDFYVY